MSDPTGPAGPCRWRERALALVLAGGLVQAALTYADFPGGRRGERLDGEAAEGLRLWRERNCQACHQIHGLGGFLGPDLTNVASRTTEDELEPLLVRGRNAMPAFGLDREQRSALVAFFRALDRTGPGEPPPLPSARTVEPPRHFHVLAASHAERSGRPLPEPVARGDRIVLGSGCGACHVPLAGGRHRAPDLTLVADVTPEAETRRVLAEGRNAMPAFPLSPAEQEDLAGYLRWLAREREGLRRTNDEMLGRERFSWGRVPWWEYR
ncbi:MAG: cytochrome c [Planctomycetales bacterium]|nr:cytochrome c [Planctomycetales bacterium]